MLMNITFRLTTKLRWLLLAVSLVLSTSALPMEQVQKLALEKTLAGKNQDWNLQRYKNNPWELQYKSLTCNPVSAIELHRNNQINLTSTRTEESEELEVTEVSLYDLKTPLEGLTVKNWYFGISCRY